ncbi:MAG: tRNA epoxyqueuosine(34) reductase QueG [Armatimonadota bacterium]
MITLVRTSDLKRVAIALGLHAVGTAPAIDEVRDVYPWARSVICAAVSYLPPEEELARDRPRGLVARFARSTDYHVLLRKKLADLARCILEMHPGGRVEICVDTTPLPERKLAVLAGIGWLGWNCCVFVQGCGSWVALGEIVTDIRLCEESPQVEDYCSSCGRCMRACPTGAIVAPRVLDRSLCLSDVTQRPGSVPVELRVKLGNRVYGCDVCQEVCPQNESAGHLTPEFAERCYPGAYPDLIELMGLTKSEYDRFVKPSSIGWLGRTRLRRNAVVAVGNCAGREELPALKELLEDPSPVVREHAQWAVVRILERVCRG